MFIYIFSRFLLFKMIGLFKIYFHKLKGIVLGYRYIVGYISFYD